MTMKTTMTTNMKTLILKITQRVNIPTCPPVFEARPPSHHEARTPLPFLAVDRQKTHLTLTSLSSEGEIA